MSSAYYLPSLSNWLCCCYYCCVKRPARQHRWFAILPIPSSQWVAGNPVVLLVVRVLVLLIILGLLLALSSLLLLLVSLFFSFFFLLLLGYERSTSRRSVTLLSTLPVFGLRRTESKVNNYHQLLPPLPRRVSTNTVTLVRVMHVSSDQRISPLTILAAAQNFGRLGV